MNDPAFRERLVADPHGAVQDELGVPLPSEVRVTVLQETPDTLYLVLPSTSETPPGRELSDAELGAVAGGAVGDTWYNECQLPFTRDRSCFE